MMIVNWKKTHLFRLHKKKDRISKEEKTEIKNLEEQSGKKLVEDLYGEIKSLKSNLLDMGIKLNGFEQAHREAKYELEVFMDEIERIANQKTLTIENKRNIEATSVCLKSQLAREESHLTMAKILHQFQITIGIFNLECKIKEIKKRQSSSIYQD